MFLKPLVQESLKVPARVWKPTFKGLMEDDSSKELDQIKAPSLIIWGDRDTTLPKDFHFIFIALRSFMHLLSKEDQFDCLQRVHQHLHPQGKFILTAIAPDREKLAQTPSDVFTIRHEFDLPNGHHVLRKERLLQHDRINQVRHFEFKFEEFDTSGHLVRERIVPLKTRYLLNRANLY